MPIIGKLKGDLVALTKSGLFTRMVHGANCFNTMNSGIAKQVKLEFPEAYQADCKTVKGDRTKLGTYSVARIDLNDFSDTRFIYNLYTQYEYGYDNKDRLDYTALYLGFNKINNNSIDTSGWRTLPLTFGIPKIGCGLAGGDWNRVQSIINEATPNINLYYVEYEEL